MAELPVCVAAMNLVTAISELPTNAARIAFTEEGDFMK
jgi:hypothetical protein